MGSGVGPRFKCLPLVTYNLGKLFDFYELCFLFYKYVLRVAVKIKYEIRDMKVSVP